MLSASPIIVTLTGLSPLASGVASATYTIKASDIAMGEVSNSATVSGLSSQGNINNLSSIINPTIYLLNFR